MVPAGQIQEVPSYFDAPLNSPVFDAVVSKLIATTLWVRFQSCRCSNVDFACSAPVPADSFGTIKICSPSSPGKKHVSEIKKNQNFEK
jgi:hypothetical protein